MGACFPCLYNCRTFRVDENAEIAPQFPECLLWERSKEDFLEWVRFYLLSKVELRTDVAGHFQGKLGVGLQLQD